MPDDIQYEDYIEICQILFSVSKLDIRLFDMVGNMIFQSTNHTIPIVLNNPENEYAHIEEILLSYPTNSYFHYINSYGLEYMAIGIWKPSFLGSIIVGPLISRTSVFDLIKDSIYKNKLPISERKHLEEFYQSLPVLSETEYKHIGELLVNLCGHSFMKSQCIASHSSKQPILNQKQLKVKMEENQNIIENRYESQNKLMDAIKRGNKAEVNLLTNSMTLFRDFTDRVPGSPIRSSKNMMIVLNTLFRLAAEQGGVHPVYLDNISEKFAILIERTTDIPGLKKLSVLMGNEYCDLVNTFSTKSYSSIVKRTVDYIQLNLGHQLPLNEIAQKIHVNPSHLSRKFKEDTGMNITEFINQKRIEEAKLYLQRGNISITDIAFMVGFNDVNYFSKVFKKITSLTPSQYEKQNR